MMKTLKLQPEVVIVIVMTVLIIFLFWTACIFIGYVADSWSSPPADERSIPAAKN
jgi:hypothetical protein